MGNRKISEFFNGEIIPNGGIGNIKLGMTATELKTIYDELGFKWPDRDPSSIEQSIYFCFNSRHKLNEIVLRNGYTGKFNGIGIGTGIDKVRELYPLFSECSDELFELRDRFDKTVYGLYIKFNREEKVCEILICSALDDYEY